MDQRWKQRLDSLIRAFGNLEAGLALGSWNPYERQGVIKAFELAYELAWKTLQDRLNEAEIPWDGGGPRSVVRAAVEAGWLTSPELWARVHEARNRAAHVYDLDKATELFDAIRAEFAPALGDLVKTLRTAP